MSPKKDGHWWNKRICVESAFDPLFRLFAHNGFSTNNLLNSSILSVFYWIEHENIFFLIRYLGDSGMLEKFREKVNYVKTFVILQEKYDNGPEIITEKRSSSTVVCAKDGCARMDLSFSVCVFTQ